jgi:putative endopeptidase
LHLAYLAFVEQRRNEPPAAAPGQFTDDQLFFLGAAQAWCNKMRDENARLRITVDPHSPPRFRINGPLSNLTEFAAAFHCGPNDKMVRRESCSIW